MRKEVIVSLTYHCNKNIHKISGVFSSISKLYLEKISSKKSTSYNAHITKNRYFEFNTQAFLRPDRSIFTYNYVVAGSLSLLLVSLVFLHSHLLEKLKIVLFSDLITVL